MDVEEVSRKSLLAAAKEAGGELFYRSTDGRFVLFKGDSRKILDSLKGQGIEANLIYADPPYHLSNEVSPVRMEKW